MSKAAIKTAVSRALTGARPSLTGWWRANCPECLQRTGKPDVKQAMSINVRTGVFWCWKCKVKGRLDNAPETPEHAVAVIAKEMEPPEGYVTLASEEGRLSMSLEPARRYLETRVPRELWFEAGLGACITGYYAGRVIIPVFDEDDTTWVGWVGRTWYPSDRAYIYPVGMDRGSVLYNGRALREETDKPLLVVEGGFDALHLWPDSAAVLGKASEAQMEALCTTDRPVVWVLDGDAWMEGYACAARMRLAGRTAGYVRLPPTLDPDQVPLDWLWDEVMQAF